MGNLISKLTTTLAGRSASLALLTILASLFSVIDIASRVMGERLSRLRVARVSGLGWLDAFRVSGMPAMAGGVGTRTALFSQKQPGGVFTIADMREHPASVWFVDGNAAGAGDTVGHGQNPDKPFATTGYANSSDLLASGDTVYIMPGHTETISAAGGVTSDIAGVKFIGLGEGSSKPQFTFDTLNGASWLISAANVTIKNIIGVGNKDGLTQPFHVTADDCTLDIEWRDTSNAIEAAAVVYADTVSRLDVRLKYRGFTDGNAAARVVQLIAVTGARIFLDAYGVVSTAWVNFTGTLSTDVGVFGRAYTQGVTNGSRLVVDTITNSKWWAVIEDMSAGAVYSGGSAAALASDDVSAVYTRLGAPAGASVSADIAAIKTAVDTVDDLLDTEVAAIGVDASKIDGLALDVNPVANSLAAFVASGGTALGTELADSKSIVDALGHNGSAFVAGGLGMYLPRCVEKSDGAVLSGADDLFTITGGPVRAKITGIVTTVIGGACNGKLQITTTEPAATADLNAAAVAIDSDAAGTSYRNVGATSVFTPVTAGMVIIDPVTVEDVEFLLPIGTVKFLGDGAQTGNIKWYMTYWPLSPNSAVAAAA